MIKYNTNYNVIWYDIAYIHKWEVCNVDLVLKLHVWYFNKK